MGRGLLVPLILLLAFPSVQAQSHPFQTEEVTIVAHDGIKLQATLYVPDAEGPRPAVLLAHGFGADRRDEDRYGRRYAELGWVALAWDARGFGQSEGIVGLNGPDEVEDVRSLVTWLAARPDVMLDAPDDPRIAMRGGSYGGAIQLLAAAQDPRLDALVPLITWSDLVHSLAPSNVPKGAWIQALFTYGNAGAHGAPAGNPNAGGLDPAIFRHYATVMSQGRLDAEAQAYLSQRSVAPIIGQVRAPTYLVQGWRDTLFTATEAGHTLSALTSNGVPAKLLLYEGGHGYDDLQTEVFDPRETRIDAWLSYWLEGKGSFESLFAGPTMGSPVEYGARVPDEFVREQTWPPTDAIDVPFFLAARGATEPGALSPELPEGASRLEAAVIAQSSYSSMPVVQGEADPPAVDPAGTTISYDSPPFPVAQRFAGTPRLHLHVAATQPEVALFVKLYDVAPDGTATLVDRQVSVLRTNASNDPLLVEAHVVELDMVPLGHIWEKDHVLRLVVATNDAAYVGNRVPARIALFHGPTTPSQLLLPWIPIRNDTTAPAIGETQSTWAGNEFTLRVPLSDEHRVASAYLFWNESGRPRAATPVAWSFDGATFLVNPSKDAAGFTVLVSDVAGNSAVAPVDVGPGPGDAGSQRTPGPDVILLFLLSALAILRLRRRP